MTHRHSRDALAIGLFLVAVFYGDIFLGITVPAAVLLLPVILLLRIPTLAKKRPPVPVGLILLSCTAIPVVIQTLAGYGPRGKTDLVIYLPLVYAGLTMLALAGSRVDDAHLRRSLLAAGALCTVLLVGTLWLAGPSFYFVPGQNPFTVPEKEEELRALLDRETGRKSAHANTTAALEAAIAALPPDTRAKLMEQIKEVMADGVVTPSERRALGEFARSAGMDLTAVQPARIVRKGPAVTLSDQMQAFYNVKNRVRTPLGASNYLAVMFVFLFNVMLYQRSRWGLLFVALVLASMSRIGLGFLAISVAFWIAHRSGRLRQLVIAGAIGAILCGLLAGLMWEQLRTLPGAESLASRVWYLDTSSGPIAAHPIAGMPRSEIVRLFGYPITWHPHNSILHLFVLFGIIGAVAYSAYMAVVLRAFERRARVSAVWRGITAGTVVMLLWSMVEIIVLSPAFELLMAALYSVAAQGIDDSSAFTVAGMPQSSDSPATSQGGR